MPINLLNKMHNSTINHSEKLKHALAALLLLSTPLAGIKAATPVHATTPSDTIVIIQSPGTPAPDDIYSDESTIVVSRNDSIKVATVPETPAIFRSENVNADLVRLGDRTHDVGIKEFAISAGIFTAAALFVRTPKLVQAREWVQKHVSHHGNDKTEIDNYIQYAPMVVGYGLDFLGVRSQHRLLDRTILLAMSYATFAVVNISAKTAFKEKRPDSDARNSFPSGHTGTVFVGAEFMRREYWNTNKFIASAGYAVAIAVGYLRIHNDRHWINDVVGGAALGYLSTTFAYWVYPKIFRKRVRMHRDQLLQRIQSGDTPDKLLKTQQVSWIASPFASDGFYGVSAAITF